MSIKNQRLDAEEQEVIDAYNKGELKSVANLENAKESILNAAKKFGNKDKRISIRMTSWDYRKAHEKALIEGLGYQTLLSSVLHKYLTGQLVEKRAS